MYNEYSTYVLLLLQIMDLNKDGVISQDEFFESCYRVSEREDFLVQAFLNLLE